MSESFCCKTGSRRGSCISRGNRDGVDAVLYACNLKCMCLWPLSVGLIRQTAKTETMRWGGCRCSASVSRASSAAKMRISSFELELLWYCN